MLKLGGLCGAKLICEGFPKEIGPAEGQRGLQKELRRKGHGAGAGGKTAQKTREGHDCPRSRGHEKALAIDAQLMEHKGHRVDKHRRRDVADAPFHPAADQIAQGGARQGENPRKARPGAGHHGHAEGRAALQHPGAGHHKAQQHVYAAAPGDQKAPVKFPHCRR